MSAGGSHQRHVCQNDLGPAGELDFKFWKLSGVFVVSGIWVNELSFDRSVRSLNHLYAITLRIVLNFVHDVVDEEHSTAGGSKQVLGVARVRNLTNVEALALVFNSETRFFRRQLSSDLHQLIQIVFVTVLHGVNKCLVESDEKIRSFRTN